MGTDRYSASPGYRNVGTVDADVANMRGPPSLATVSGQLVLVRKRDLGRDSVMPRERRVYYAASLFNEGEREFNRQVVSMIHDLGYSTWFPQEDVGLLSDFIDNDGMSLDEARDHIFRLNI